jgi:hypothetical protein
MGTVLSIGGQREPEVELRPRRPLSRGARHRGLHLYLWSGVQEETEMVAEGVLKLEVSSIEGLWKREAGES